MSKGDAIELLCPVCGTLSACNVKQTVSGHSAYRFRDFFENLTGLDSSFRKRIRECSRCQSNVNTIEVNEQLLDALRNKLNSVTKALEEINGNLGIESNSVRDDIVSTNESSIEAYIDFYYFGFPFAAFAKNGKPKLLNYLRANSADADNFIVLIDKIISPGTSDSTSKILTNREKEFLRLKYGIGSKKMNRRKIRNRFLGDDKQIEEFETKIVGKIEKSGKADEILNYVQGLREKI